jgi:tetratricopeptide (TPR) repeat protein
MACVFGSLATSQMQAQTNMFQQAAAAYRAGNYTDAAKRFGETAQHDPASGTLQNLGLSEWHRGRTGLAIRAWEQALWVDPFNKAARENLRFARKAAQLEAPELAWHEAASMWLPVNAWAVLAGVSLWLAVGMVLLPRILRWRRAGWHQALAAAGFAVFLLCLPSLVGVHTRMCIGFVLEKETPLRLTPTREAQTVTMLAAGQPARCERTRGNYLLVRTSYGQGWIERGQFGWVCPK